MGMCWTKLLILGFFFILDIELYFNIFLTSPVCDRLIDDVTSSFSIVCDYSFLNNIHYIGLEMMWLQPTSQFSIFHVRSLSVWPCNHWIGSFYYSLPRVNLLVLPIRLTMRSGIQFILLPYGPYVIPIKNLILFLSPHHEIKERFSSKFIERWGSLAPQKTMKCKDKLRAEIIGR